MEKTDLELDVREAETALLKVIQAMIVEPIDFSFLQEIDGYLEAGMSKGDALRKAIVDHGYHLTSGIEA